MHAGGTRRLMSVQVVLIRRNVRFNIAKYSQCIARQTSPYLHHLSANSSSLILVISSLSYPVETDSIQSFSVRTFGCLFRDCFRGYLVSGSLAQRSGSVRTTSSLTSYLIPLPVVCRVLCTPSLPIFVQKPSLFSFPGSLMAHNLN